MDLDKIFSGVNTVDAFDVAVKCCNHPYSIEDSRKIVSKIQTSKTLSLLFAAVDKQNQNLVDACIDDPRFQGQIIASPILMIRTQNLFDFVLQHSRIRVTQDLFIAIGRIKSEKMMKSYLASPKFINPAPSDVAYVITTFSDYPEFLLSFIEDPRIDLSTLSQKTVIKCIKNDKIRDIFLRRGLNAVILQRAPSPLSHTVTAEVQL